jgi:spoIIIJ-associated protein
MATETYEFSGKSVDEAVAEGLRALQLSADQVDIEVLNKGSRGIFGLGSEPAQVRLRPRRPATATPPAVAPMPTPPATVAEAAQAETLPPVGAQAENDLVAQAPAAMEVVRELEAEEVEPEEVEPEEVQASNEITASDEEVESIAVDLLTQMMALMGFSATVESAWRTGHDELSEHSDRYLSLDVQGAELGALIGRRGETLDNLQYLLRLMVNQRLHRWQNIVVDVEGYKERRINQLQQLAQRTASQVADTGRSVSLEPMPPNERRIIHIALRDHPDVYTESTGEADRRKVHIVSKNH